MKIQSIIVLTIILLYINGLSGCFEQSKQNNGTNIEDTKGPTTPTDIRCTTPKTDNKPAFSWDPSFDISGIAGYYVKIDNGTNTWIGNISSWKSVGVIADGAHTFYVKAKDGSIHANNGSYESCPFIINITTVEKFLVADANGPYGGLQNHSIIFNGSKSYTTNGNIINYTWNLGDETNLYGKIIRHAYTKPGVFKVTLTIIDNDNLTASNTTTVNIVSDGIEGPGEYHSEKDKFIGTWQKIGNEIEYWIFYSNGTQKTALLITDDPILEPYFIDIWSNYTISSNLLCLLVLDGYSTDPICYEYEFSKNNTMLTLSFNNIVVLKLNRA